MVFSCRNALVAYGTTPLALYSVRYNTDVGRSVDNVLYSTVQYHSTVLYRPARDKYRKKIDASDTVSQE